MKKGNLYKTKENTLIVLFLNNTNKENFKGIVLWSSVCRDVISASSDFFKIKDFEEYIGDLTLNNVMNERK